MSHHHFPARGIGIEGGSALFGQRRQQHGSSSRDRLRRVAILAACALGAVGSLVLLLNGGGSATPSEAGAEAATAGIRGGGGTPFLEKARAGPGGGGGAPATTAPAMPETKQGRCAAAGQTLRARGGWDYMRVMRRGEAAKASLVHQGSLARLHAAIERANTEKRSLRIAILGGSFSAGGAVADMRDSYAEVLASLLSGTVTDGGDGPTGRHLDNVLPSPVKHGAEVTNMAQGGAGFMLPLFCTMKVYSMVAEDPSLPPDVWVVEFGENFDATLEQYEALLAMLLYDEARFGTPAVLTTAVAKNYCWWSEGDVRSTQCGLHRTMGWLETAARTMAVPLVSFLHGVAPFVGYQPATNASTSRHNLSTLPALLLETSDRLEEHAFPGLHGRLDKVVKQLYADCGENQHFNEYGHRLLGHFLYHVFQEATHVPLPLPAKEALKEAGVRERMPAKAMEMYQRVSSGSSSQTLTCNLTLTQGRAVDLVPVATRNYSLWAEKAEGSSNIFSGARKRSDRKQTWTPDMEGASLDFDLPIAKEATTLCVLMYGASGMFLNASFPGHETTTTSLLPPLNDGEEEAEEGMTATVDTTCVYRGGVDWTIYSVYKTDCGCQLPPAMADGGLHRVRLTNAKGKVQVAGVVIW